MTGSKSTLVYWNKKQKKKKQWNSIGQKNCKINLASQNKESNV